MTTTLKAQITTTATSIDDRLGIATADRRRHLENKPQRLGSGKKHLPLQMLEPGMILARRALKFLGLYRALAERTLRCGIIENGVYIRGLPESLEGVRILHLSDLHIDSTRGFGQKLADICSFLDFDVACITGDLRLDTRGPIAEVIEEMTPLVRLLASNGPAIAVLGNHDVLELVEPLESLGLRYLLNESAVVRFHDTDIHFAGVDDVHYFGTGDMPRSLGLVPLDATTVMLCHSPDLVREAAEGYVDLYLTGHTHGGQLCLPGGQPLVSNANCERRFIAGPWRYGSMLGYTSRGVGFSGIPLRAFCRAEVVIHTLRRERRNRCRVEAAEALSRAK